MNLNKAQKELLKKFKSQHEKQLYLITFWLIEFPCQEYFKKSRCILEYITPEKLYNFIKGLKELK
jgi:hypothetical protein